MDIDERVSRFRPIIHLDTVDSTNRWAVDAVASGQAGEAVVVADGQTAGRGRLDRRWESPPGTALLVSIILRPPDLPARRGHLLTALIALAAREACSAVGGFTPDVKWPNDLLVGDRKLAGVLAQAASGAVVVGIGVNLTAAPPGAVTATEAAGRLVGRDDLLAALLVAADRRYGRWDDLAAEYGSTCATVGRRVRVEGVGVGAREGDAEGIDDGGRLLVRFATGPEAISAADVIHLRIASRP